MPRAIPLLLLVAALAACAGAETAIDRPSVPIVVVAVDGLEWDVLLPVLAAGRNVWKGMLREGVPAQVYPPRREAEMLGILRQVQADLPALVGEIFGDFEHPLSPLGRRLWDNCLWAFRADATYLRVALALARETPRADLTLVYFGGPDVVGHRFWRYRDPSLYRHPPDRWEIEDFGDVLDDYYRFIDRAIGQLLAAHGADTAFIVLSDHGMRPVNRDQRFDPEDLPADVNSAHHEDAPAGVLIAAGPGIGAPSTRRAGLTDRAELESLGGVLDIAPTLLAMLRVPIGRDMPGRILTELFDDGFRIDLQPPTLASHDTSEFLASRGAAGPVDPGEHERVEQLRSLGYVD